MDFSKLFTGYRTITKRNVSEKLQTKTDIGRNKIQKTKFFFFFVTVFVERVYSPLNSMALAITIKIYIYIYENTCFVFALSYLTITMGTRRGSTVPSPLDISKIILKIVTFFLYSYLNLNEFSPEARQLRKIKKTK